MRKTSFKKLPSLDKLCIWTSVAFIMCLDKWRFGQMGVGQITFGKMSFGQMGLGQTLQCLFVETGIKDNAKNLALVYKR